MATRGVNLDNTWVKVAENPCFLERHRGMIGVYFGTERPAADLAVYHKLDEQSPCINYGGKATTFVRNISADARSTLVITESE